MEHHIEYMHTYKYWLYYSYYESNELFKDKQFLKARVHNIGQKGEHLTSSVWPNVLYT